MTRYWLTPIIQKEPLVLGAERICCEPIHVLEPLREAFQDIHPRLLPMFKASLLLSDEEDLCGDDEAEVDWDSGADIHLDGSPLVLSHCAEAFLDRLLSAIEVKRLLVDFTINDSDKAVNELQMLWIQYMNDWLNHGWEIILLREDGV
ncbi:hypothetical protein D3C73_748790 [compost metagenome]